MNATMKRLVAVVLPLCIAAACGGPGEEPAPGQVWAGTCARDEALVSEQRSCGRDDDCPCGTHCALGVCVAACTWNSDCAGGTVCDGFGRCVAPLQAGSVPGVAGGRRGELHVDRSQIELFEPDSVQPIQLSARILDVTPVRIEAEAGIEVDCGDGTFASTCTLDAVKADSPGHRLRVRSVGPRDAEDVRRALTVHAQGQRLTVGVRLVGSAPPVKPPRHGVYVGKALLRGAGLKLRTFEDTLPADLARLELDVRAEIFPEQNGVYTLRLYDERHTVFPEGAVATLSLKSGSPEWELVMPSRQYLGEDVDNVPAGALDVHARGRMDAPIFREGLLDGDLVVTFEGVSPVDQAPFVRWHLTLARAGDLPQGATAPMVTERPVANVAMRTQTPLPEEKDIQGVVKNPSIIGDDVARAAAALCSSPESAPVTSFSDTTNAAGDLLCAGGAPMKAFGFEAGKLADRGAYVSDCIAELSAATATPAPGDGSAAAQCADRIRAVSAMAFALETDRERALGLANTPYESASRLGMRFVQQWLSLQVIAAREPRRLHTLAPLLPEGNDLSGLLVYEDRAKVLEGLRHSVEGWDVVLHPRVAAALIAAPPDALRVPDYRVSLYPGGSFTDGEQKMGLPVSMLTALTQQLDGLDGAVQDVLMFRSTDGERAAITRELSLALPRNLVVFAMAQGLHDAARSTAVPSWESQWEAAKVTYGAQMARLVRQIRFLESGANPLGIEDVDLPLYRVGDQEGTGRRFSAVSDSLLGREDLLDPAIAPTLIEQARQAEQLARSSVTALLQRDLTEAFEAAGVSRRLEAIHRHYGEQITSFCGAWDSLSILNTPEIVDPDTCFLEDSCTYSLDEVKQRLNTADLGYQICLAAKLRERFGDAVTTGQKEMDAELDRVYGGLSAETNFFSVDFAHALIDGFSSAYEGIEPVRIDLPSGVDKETLAEVESICEAARQVTLGQRPTTAPASCASTDECPVGMYCQTAASTCVPEDDLPDPDCFRGSMGEVAVALLSASAEVDIARSELEEYTERYDNAVRGCFILQQGNQAVQRAMAAHDATMTELATAKLAADTAAKAAEKAAGLFSVESFTEGFGTVLFGGIQQAAESTSDTIALRMEQAQRQHEMTLAALEAETAERLCFNEAEAELVGARSAALRVRQQMLELARQLVEFRNLKINLQAAVDEGLASLKAEELRRVSPAQVDHWLDANVDLFDQRMRRARRALYLAVLAVEYEFQFSSSERTEVLAARTPADLGAVLSRLRDRTRRGAPQGGGNPTELLTVVSLRQNLMQIADRSTLDPAWHALSEEERFRRILVSPRYAVYGGDGRYLGQEIPFTIQPLGALDLGDTGAIPLLSGLNCAERLWSVNASILGDDLMHRTDSTIATVQIRKRNTFMSQYCTPRGDQLFQTASTRPSRNLFVDPYSAASWANDGTLTALTDTREVNAFAGATVQARLNVSRKELEREEYQNGDSRALAGRGVFGDYTLFIPATTQSINGSTGLRLENVRDVLIRIDYVAAEIR